MYGYFSPMLEKLLKSCKCTYPKSGNNIGVNSYNVTSGKYETKTYNSLDQYKG